MSFLVQHEGPWSRRRRFRRRNGLRDHSDDSRAVSAQVEPQVRFERVKPVRAPRRRASIEWRRGDPHDARQDVAGVVEAVRLRAGEAEGIAGAERALVAVDPEIEDAFEDDAAFLAGVAVALLTRAA